MTARPVATLIPGLVLCSVVAAHAQAGPCSCSDKQYLLNRLNLVEAAILEYKEQIVGMTNREKLDGKPLMTTRELYKKVLQDRVNDVLKRINDPNANTGTSETNGGDCSLEHVTAPTACMRESLTRHEAVHIASCKSYQDAPGAHTTYQTRMRLADLAREEIVAYLEERTFILQQLKALPASCRPSGWFGFVEYQTLEQTESNETTVAKPYYKRPSAGIVVKEGASYTQKIGTGYFGTVLVENSQAVAARADASYTYSHSSQRRGRVFCNYTKAPDVKATDTASRDANLNGEGTGTASFQIKETPARNSYSIYIKLIPVKTTGSSVDTSTPPVCIGGPPKTYTSSPTLVITPSPHTINGTMTQKDLISGYLSEKPASRQFSNTSTTTTNSGSTTVTSSQSFTIVTRWMLRRLPP